MLTIATINPKQAEEYYQQENYYSKGAALENSEWFGRGAEKLELSGEIADNQVYKNLVNGLSPDGKQALRGKPQGLSKEEAQTNSPSKQSKKQKKQSKERAGVDLTFSAPKSVSLACLVGGDGRLEEAHRRAVKRTLEFIEQHYPQTRIKKERVKTDNLTVALWHHDTSRELDPHLHTHCILMNFTCLPNGKWQSRTDENLYYNKMLLGQIYRQELALECRALGYEIEPQPKELFEIKGYTREQIEAFSKRHEQIVEYLEEREIDVNTENKVWAWRRTRVKKNHEMGRNEKLEHWHEEADLYGIVHPVPVQEIGRATATTSEVTQDEEVEAKSVATQDEEIEVQLQAAIGVAIEHCKERKVAFKLEDILKFVTAELKPFSTSQLEQAIPQHPELIKTYDGKRYTTQTALARELATIKLMQQGKGQFSPIAAQETIDSYLADKKLTSGQQEAIALTATSTDQFIAWQGVAGAGKTYVLNELKQLIQVLQEVTESGEITLLAGYAPSKEATLVLGKEIGIETNTVASLLLSKQIGEPKPNQLWIVDEAGMLSAKDGYALLQRATAAGARVILVGDTRQLSAVEAGNPFKSLQQAGISTAHLSQSLRQKVPDLQHAASLAAAGNHFDALQHLEAVGRLKEAPDLDERNKLIADDYLQLSPDQRQSTLVLVGTHKEKDAVMQHIREGLKEEGLLVGDEAVLTRLKRKDLTKVQSRYQHHYNIGDVVIPLREYKRAGLSKDRAYAVCGYGADKLILSDWSGNQIAVDPMKFRKTVYTQQEIAICVGEKLRWIKEDKQNGRSNRDEFIVTAIEDRTATIRYKNGKEESLYLDQPLPLDYAIASTTYSSQGKTADRVLISSTVDATVSQESVYVAISRAKYDLKIYAENVDFLLEQAQESKAQETVLELLRPPQAKVKVSSVPARAVTSSVKQSVGVSATPKVAFEEESPVSNIERPLKRQNQQVAKPTPSPTLKPHSPKQLEVFWQPNSDRSCPSHIEAKHWRELVEGSAIHPDIAALNFRSLQMGSIEQEHQAWEYLMYSPKLERTNTGQLTTGYLKKYAHIEAGGWWCNSGANARSFSNEDAGGKPQEKIWGCYKPNEPRSNPDKPGKVIKYEHPPKTDLGIFLLDVPEYIAEKIYAKAGIDPSENERASGFWYCVWKYNLPIVVAEGAKKAASLLSQGHAAIGLPGIYAGYRSKDEQGNPIKAHLHEELAAFATLGRSITFCFDYETRLETKQNIEIAISRTGSLLRQQGAKVSVVSLSGPEKGVDDLIVARTPLAFEQQLSAALPLQQWREANKQQRLGAIAPPQKLNIEQRKQRLNQSLTGQPLIHDQNLNRAQEQISDDIIDWRRANNERAADAGLDISQSHALVDQVEQEGRSIGENQQPTGYEARPINHHWQSIEQTDYSLGERANRELERIESQPSELSTAISRHAELQEVEQLGADIAELDRSLADGFLSNQGTEQANQIVAHEEKLPQQLQQSQTQENLSQSGEHNDGRHSNTQCDHQLDSQHGRSESSEQRSFAAERQLDAEYGKVASAEHQLDSQHGGVESPKQRRLRGEQGTQELHPQATERYSVDSQADAGRLHHPVQGSPGGTEVGQTERDNPRVSDIHEQSVAQAGGHQPDSSPSQRAGDGNLRGDYQPTETIAQQRQELSASGQQEWAQALGDLAQVVQSVSKQQLLGDAELERQLTTLTFGLKTLNLQQRKPYEFTGLSELAQAFTQQQLKSDLVESLEQLRQQKLAVDAEIAQARSSASTQTCELQPKIADLARAVSAWHSKVEIAQAIFQVSEIAQQLEPRHTFDFGNLPQLLNRVSNEQRFRQSGLDTKIAMLKGQIAAVTLKAPTRFEGMSALAGNLQAVQAQSQLLEADLTERLSAIASVVTNFNPQGVRYEEDGKKALSELAQVLQSANNERVFENAGLESQLIALTQQLNDLNPQPEKYEFTGLSGLAQAISQQQSQGALVENLEQIGALISKLTTRTLQITALSDKAPTRFEGMSALVENLQAVQAQSQLLETDLTRKLNAIAFLVANSHPQVVRYKEANVALSELAQTLHSLVAEQQLLQGRLLDQLQQTTGKAISAISQHIEQSKEDLSMLQTVERLASFKQALGVTAANNKEAVTKLTQQLRDLPLDEVAIRLGLTQDKYDKHKWRGEGQIISINDQKFYDHANLKGGYGAIDLVMLVQARDFKEALGWLADSALELPPVSVRVPQPQVIERQPFQPPSSDESKWLAVRQYLTQKRQLPVALVDELHTQGKVYADVKQNAVFLRQDVDGNLTGASLRGTYNDTPFKGLSVGSQREGGWFSFTQGEGQLQRIVITESAIDALSAAALTDQPGRTMFVSTDGAGSVPTAWLKQQQQQRVEIVAAHDSDRAGEAMAWRLATELGTVTRATPTVGKDWNEHLLGIGSQPDISQWKLVAQAIGRPDAYLGRIEAIVASGQPLPIEAAAAMRLDFNAYKQTANDLWQWQEAAKEVGKPDAYLERITQVAIAFHHSKSPMPLPKEAAIAMHQDLAQHQQLLSVKLWQHYSRDADPAHPIKTASIVAYGAAKDGYSPDKIHQILQHDPTLVKIRERSGDAAAQNHLKIALQFADYQMRLHQQPHQINKQQQLQQKPGLQL